MSARDSCLLRGLLRLIEHRLSLKWIPSDDGAPSDIIVIDADSTEGQQSTALASSGSWLPILCAATVTPSHPRVLLKPIRIHGPNGLVDVLNRTAEERQLLLQQRQQPAPGKLSIDQLCRDLDSPAVIEANGVPLLYITPPDFCFIPAATSSTRDLLGSINTEPSTLRTLTVEQAKSEAERHGFKKIPFPYLLWAAHLSGLIANTVDASTKYRLKRWPEFAQLSYEPAHLAYAAILTRRAASAADLAATTPDSTVERAQAFLSACSALNLLAAISQPAEAPSRPAQPERNSGILRSILRRLGRRYA